MAAQFASVDEYISTFPDDVQVILETIRRTIREVVPVAGEAISYQMPMITSNGRPLVHIAGWKQHIGLYPVPVADGVLEQELAPYRSGKDTVRFPFRQPIPYDLVERLATFLVSSRE